MGWWVYLLGASMRMGAEMPRYSREKLGGVRVCAFGGLERREREERCVPFILDDFPEAVYHAIICLIADALACLELPVMS